MHQSKLSVNRIYTNRELETSKKNLFVAGDGAGLSRGIVVAAATGIIAARGILKKVNQSLVGPRRFELRNQNSGRVDPSHVA